MPGNMKKLNIFILLAILFVSTSASAIDFTSHGYYRNRTVVTENLDTQKPDRSGAYDNNRFGMISYGQMRLRLLPDLKLNDFLSIHAQFDILDDVLYGTKDTQQIDVLSPVMGTISLPAGAGSISMVGGVAGANQSINVRRAWAEVLTPIGKLKFGRQPSNWGLGIFQNDGMDIQADFGDSADRLMFITQKQFDNGGALSVGALWDIAFEAQPDPRTEGLGGIIRDNGQDTNQWAAVLIYEQPAFTTGVFGGIRKRDGGSAPTMTALGYTNPAGATCADCLTSGQYGRDGDTLVYFADVYGRYTYENYNFMVEGVYIGGKMSTGLAIDALPIGNAVPPNNGVIELPPKQPTRVFMAAFEANARYKFGGEWFLKAGFAQGDATPLSNRITQYGFRPDYQIALLMFNLPLGTSPAIRPLSGPASCIGSKVAGGLPITGNFVNNAIYVAATYKHHFDFSNQCKNCNDFSAGLRVVTAWADKPPVELDLSELVDPTYPDIRSNGKWYGVEVDTVIEGRFYDHFYAALEGGVLIPGSAYNIDVNIIPAGVIQPISSVKAVPAYGGRLTLMLEF